MKVISKKQAAEVIKENLKSDDGKAGTANLHEQRFKEEQAKKQSMADMDAVFDAPAFAVNDAHIAGDGSNLRLSFLERGSHGKTACRAAVLISMQNGMMLYNALGQVYAPILEAAKAKQAEHDKQTMAEIGATEVDKSQTDAGLSDEAAAKNHARNRDEEQLEQAAG